MRVKKKIGQLLCDCSYLVESDLDLALKEQGVNSCRLGEILLKRGYVSVNQLNEALAFQAGIKKITLDDVSVGEDIISLVPAEIVNKHNVFPLAIEDGRLAIALSEPFNRQIMEELRLVSGYPIFRYYADPIQIERAILKFYGSNIARMLDDLAPVDQQGESDKLTEDYSAERLSEMAREPSLVNLVNLIILEGIEANASDIHIEPFELEVKIKYRIDGMLIEKTPSSKRLQAAIISRVKIMANMNIAERFIPQDGHIEFGSKNGKVDIRVSTVPTVFGESITMRILDRSTSLIELNSLGMDAGCLDHLDHCLRKAHGIVLVTGPTGSGKTTTLYAALNRIYSPSMKIITIEDPVEYQLDGIIQMQINPKRGLTFATGLRHILRQDPDIIMVGEIRDRETADIAIRAAMTGHLVFSTLHTNDAAGAITRLIDMGVEPFLLAGSLEAVLAQRLVRRVCPKCKQPYKPDAALIKSLNGSLKVKNDFELYRGVGCDDCMNTGSKGRVGIFELLRVTDSLRELIAGRPTPEQILKSAPEDHVNMRRDGINKMLAGQTTPEEVFRVTQTIEDDEL